MRVIWETLEIQVEAEAEVKGRVREAPPIVPPTEIAVSTVVLPEPVVLAERNVTTPMVRVLAELFPLLLAMAKPKVQAPREQAES